MHIDSSEVGAVCALVGVVSRFGTVTTVEQDHVTIELADIAYRFFVHSGEGLTSQTPLVLFASIGYRSPGWAPSSVLDGRTGGSFEVQGDAAARITAAFDRFGQCSWCAGYGHEQCVGHRGDRCRCACWSAWDATRAVAAALRIMADAPAVTR